jgi:hypothetical protein
MDLISCDHCGVVLDAQKLDFPWDIYVNGEIDDSKAVWDSDAHEYVAFVACPVCDHSVKKPF